MFSKNQRVPRDIIKRVISEGQKCYSELFLFKKMNNDVKRDRFAVIVSKKVTKNAVKRHLIKRRFLNAIAENISNFGIENNKNGRDFVLLVSPQIKDITYSAIMSELQNKKYFLLN